MGSVVLLDQVINGLQFRVCCQHGIVQGGHSLLKWCSVRVNKVDVLLVLGLVLGLGHSVLPSVLLGALHDLEALFKDRALLVVELVQEGVVCNQQIRHHLVHIIGVILADIAVTVIGQSQLVVLGAVQNTGLQCGVHITEAHGGRRAAQQTHHFHVGGRLLHADLQTLQVGGLVDGGLDGVEVAGAGIQPCHRFQTGLGSGLENGVRHLGVVHRLVVGFYAGEQVRQVEDLVFGAEGLHDGSGCHYKVDGTGLGQLHHFGLGAQQLAGVHLHAVLVAQLLVDVVGKGFQS